jgi:hypothetical protein
VSVQPTSLRRVALLLEPEQDAVFAPARRLALW